MANSKDGSKVDGMAGELAAWWVAEAVACSAADLAYRSGST